MTHLTLVGHSGITKTGENRPPKRHPDGPSKGGGTRKIIPSYAVDLLLAAKWVVNAPVGSMPALKAQYLQDLETAIVDFEQAMPIDDGGTIREASEH